MLYQFWLNDGMIVVNPIHTNLLILYLSRGLGIGVIM